MKYRIQTTTGVLYYNMDFGIGDFEQRQSKAARHAHSIITIGSHVIAVDRDGSLYLPDVRDQSTQSNPFLTNTRSNATDLGYVKNALYDVNVRLTELQNELIEVKELLKNKHT